MIVLGGLARLTGSGLSMVNWDPINSWLPPLNSDDWNNIFNDYCKSPEFHYINWDIDIESFKSIFWLEYLHRLWGRLMFFPLLWSSILVFYYNRYNFLRSRFILIWFFSILQGLMGWYMVKSGLVSDPYVSPYRLSCHMILALVIISMFAWTYFELYYAKFSFFSISLLNMVTAILLLTTITFGALVAGLKAGLIYNTFPLMGGDLIPIEVGTFIPIWRDMLENPVTVQLAHRFLALLTASAIIYSSILYYSRRSARILICCIVVQLSLGIATLIMHVPLLFAILHQIFGVILFVSLLYFFYDSNNCILRRENS